MRAIRYLVYILQLSLLYFFFTGLQIGDSLRAFWSFFSFLLTLSLAMLERHCHIRFHPMVKLTVALPLFIHIAGGIQRWYFLYSPFYDKIAHLISGSSLTFLFFLSLLAYLRTSDITLSRIHLLIVPLLATMVLGTVWEIAEHSIDLVFQSTYSHGIVDALLDHLFNFLGAGLTTAFVYRKWREIPLRNLYEQFFHANERGDFAFSKCFLP